MAEENDMKQTGATEPAQQGQFGMQKVYTRDLSFESPNAPAVFQEEWQPSVNMDIANAAQPLADAIYEVTLSVTVTVSSDEKTMYLAEVQQAGIFHIGGFPSEMVKRMLATVCPNILFPFAREVVADLVMRGGFPQLLLAPVNFDALYAQHEQQVAKGKIKH